VGNDVGLNLDVNSICGYLFILLLNLYL
jgi:hypothetical protein